MNAFLTALDKFDIKQEVLRREKLNTLQVNMGDLCNQSCKHCHISASPKGKDVMSKRIVDDILALLSRYRVKALDITGGAPELNQNFDYLVTSARPLVGELIVRSNLTVLFEKGKDYLPGFFKTNKIHLICSLPCYTKENVDRQRGRGVFEASIKALKILNDFGFARQNGLVLDLVSNPVSASLPQAQLKLERDYKKALKGNYGIEFNRLLTITNAAINKFKDYLQANDEYERYFDLLENNFNPAALDSLMCYSLLSVGFDGRFYDCDFNQALGLAIKDPAGGFLTIAGLEPLDLEGREIISGPHCLSCTAGSGSGCQGALDAEPDKKDIVKHYYGKLLKSKNDLKSSACCSSESMPANLRAVIKNIEPEILDKFYGCGSPLPPLLEGCSILDLGCGAGRDVYIASYLSGENGFVTGVDMTDEQLEIARKHKDAQMKRFGFSRCNVDFKKGYIEDLKEAGIEDNSQDVVISNCVINLSPDKKRVFREIFRVLKPGGELYFSDVFADRRIPQELKNDPVLYGECLAGAMYLEDFRRLLRDLGCPDFRYISKRKINIGDPEIAEKTGGITFCSVTVRAFKLEDLEETCEDYGQAAYYKGGIAYFAHEFRLDDHHLFIAHKPVLVCANTASMLTNTRFAKYFKITGDRSVHYGPFNCSGSTGIDNAGSAGSCC